MFAHVVYVISPKRSSASFANDVAIGGIDKTLALIYEIALASLDVNVGGRSGNTADLRNEVLRVYAMLLHRLTAGGWELFRLILDVASGKKTWAEQCKLHNALVLFNPAPVT
jgi:hypothetical protein